MIANYKHQILRPIVQDFGLLNLGLLVTYLFLNHWLARDSFPLSAYLLTSTVGSVTVCLLGLALADQGRHQDDPRDFPAEIDDVARALLAGVSTLILALYLAFGLRMEPSIVGLILSVSILAILTSRLLLRPLADQAGPRNLLIVGAGAHGQGVAELLAQHPEAGFQLVGLVEERPGEAAALPMTVPVVGQGGMTRALSLLSASDVVVAPLARREALQRLLPGHVSLLHTADLYELVAGKLPVRLIPETHFDDVLAYRPSPWFDFFHRAFDIVAALIALPIVGLISLVVVPLIRWESPGPALYSQERVGLDGEVFRIYKFRSMRPDAELNGAQWAEKDDPRITRIGKFIRMTRIDEMPQFLNVLWGNMSLIGPRPERPVFVDELEKELPYFGYRHIVKPGITGWAQVQYGYGSTYNDALEKLQYDLYYIKYRTNPLLAAQIVFKTVWVILSRRGAR